MKEAIERAVLECIRENLSIRLKAEDGKISVSLLLFNPDTCKAETIDVDSIETAAFP